VLTLTSLWKQRAGRALRKGRARPPARIPVSARRRLWAEPLEPRTLLTALPFGAMPDDTGEYMLGKIVVNVVLMESDPTLAPYDNNPPTDPVRPGIGAPAEDWTSDLVASVKAKVTEGLQWWKETLVNMFPLVPPGLLDFQVNWQYADNPVRTGYEPIARPSNDFALWIYDFLNQVGFNQSGNFSTDIRAYNDFTRRQASADWAFTIFVVNNTVDADKLFAPGGSFSQAFSFSGGRFMVVPASRPASTFAHETGHQFWGLDEYMGGGSYLSRRGYYNTQNLNAADNPAPGFVQADSIMSNGTSLANAYANRTSPPTTLAMIGWQDSDNDGIFDVLDVPFTLQGSGQYSAASGLYTFTGYTTVNTLPNRNPAGLGNDITINQIRAIQASVDDGPWQTVQTLPPRTYQTNVTVNVPVPPTGSHTIKIRSIDTLTGVTSNLFVGETNNPTAQGPGINGVVFRDDNRNGRWDSGEPGLPDVGVEVLNLDNQPLDLQHFVEPSEWPQGTILNQIEPGALIAAVGGGLQNNDVLARTSSRAPSAGRVFTATSFSGQVLETWTAGRQLKVVFDAPVGTVSIRVYGGQGTTPAYGRMEAYDANGNLLTRVTSTGVTSGTFSTLTVNRVAGDIKYVHVFGHANTEVVLDTLQWGPAASATTNTLGVYSLAYLPDGTYKVRVTPPAGYVVTTPQSGEATVVVSGGMTLGSVNFGIGFSSLIRPFHNAPSPFNVDNDAANIVSPIDALMVINFLNSQFGGEGEIPSSYTPQMIGYIDVNNDGLATPIDALMVINYLNSNQRGGSGEAPPASALAGGGQGGDGPGAEGEELPAPRNAAEYYAQVPLQVLQIPGTDQPCSCGTCLGVRAEAAAAVAKDLATEEMLGLGATSDLQENVNSSRPKEQAAFRHGTALAFHESALSEEDRWLRRASLRGRLPGDPPLGRLLSSVPASEDESQVAAHRLASLSGVGSPSPPSR
jgi:hypothetical protein